MPSPPTFATDDPSTATAALLVYAVYAGRDRNRFTVTLDMWSKIERFVKSAAKRATSIPKFLEALKPRLACHTLHPALFTEETLRSIQQHKALEQEVLSRLYTETAWIIVLVREAIDRDRRQAIEPERAPMEVSP